MVEQLLKSRQQYYVGNRLVHPYPWSASSVQPWPHSHARVIMPYTETEGSRGKSNRFHILIVRKDKIVLR